jgi:hypothetical protein
MIMPTKNERFSLEYNEYQEIRKQIRHRVRQNVEVEIIREPVNPLVTVIEEEDEVILKPEKKHLSVEEKLKLLDKLAGSADRFSPEGVLETIRIANREFDQEDESE